MSSHGPRHRIAVAAPAVPPGPPTACQGCTLDGLCRPSTLGDAPSAVAPIVRMLTRGDVLFKAGERFGALFAVCSGFFKTRVAHPGRPDRITGFKMAGEWMGLDGIHSSQHGCEAIAVEDSRVCVIPYRQVEDECRRSLDTLRRFHQAMSHEIVRQQSLIDMLAGMRAEARLAAFVIDLSRRAASGASAATTLNLPMTREEIGGFLGMTLETVSRCFSRLHGDGLLRVSHRRIDILDADRLDLLAGSPEDGLPRPEPVAVLALEESAN